jgi:hypothetical protein
MTGKDPRVVAELGRPETPDEAAARKAASSRRHRENRTFTNLLAAIVVCLGVVVVMVLVVVRPPMPEREPIDVAAAAEGSQIVAHEPLIVPELPEGWGSNAAEIRTGADDIVTWHVGYITPAEQYVFLQQAIDANRTWLVTATDSATPTGERTIDGVSWVEYDQRAIEDPGNLAYVLTTEHGASTVVVGGTADDAELQLFAEAVSAQLADGE